MDHSRHPMLREYYFVVANGPLTIARATGDFPGNQTLLRLGTMKEVKGRSSTHGKSFDNDEIDTCKDW